MKLEKLPTYNAWVEEDKDAKEAVKQQAKKVVTTLAGMINHDHKE